MTPLQPQTPAPVRGRAAAADGRGDDRPFRRAGRRRAAAPLLRGPFDAAPTTAGFWGRPATCRVRVRADAAHRRRQSFRRAWPRSARATNEEDHRRSALRVRCRGPGRSSSGFPWPTTGTDRAQARRCCRTSNAGPRRLARNGFSATRWAPTRTCSGLRASAAIASPIRRATGRWSGSPRISASRRIFRAFKSSRRRCRLLAAAG